MTAASVTGVGQGSADKQGQKGSEHLFVGVEKLVGTRIVHSDTATVGGGGTVTVTLPQELPGVDADYIAITMPNSANVTWYSAWTPASAGSFIIHGHAADVVFYAVIRVTNATVAFSPNS